MNFGKKTSLGGSSAFTSGDELLEDDDFLSRGGKGKRKSRNMSEKKRRDQFNVLISELFTMVSSSTDRKMDKSTVLKATIAYIKLHNDIAVESQAHEIDENWKPSFLTNDEFIQIMLDATHGFLLVFSGAGKISYISDSVTPILGYFPHELRNHSIFDYIHKDDQIKVYNELAQHRMNMRVTEKHTAGKNLLHLQFHIKTMKSSEKGAFQKVECQGCFKKCSESDSSKEMGNDEHFCCILRLNNAPLIREIHAPDTTMREFSSRHSIEWKFQFLDHRAAPIIGFQPFEVLGTSGYDYCHPDDLYKLSECHKQLAETGEGVSCYYRFLTKGQQWLWLQTYYYISYHQWNSKPELIICTNTVIDYAVVKLHEMKEQQTNDISLPMAQIKEEQSIEQIECVGSNNPTRVGGSAHHDSSLLSQAGTSSTQDSSNVEGTSVAGSSIVNHEVRPSASQYSDVESTTEIPVPPDTSMTLTTVNMTSTQLALFHQLREKQLKLQEIIINQQRELQNITQELILSQQMIPIQQQQQQVPVPVETEPVAINTIISSFKVPKSVKGLVVNVTPTMISSSTSENSLSYNQPKYSSDNQHPD